MSSSAKSKSKDKKAGKEQKASSKASATGIPASAYNPLLGTFHTLDTSSTPSLSSLNVNGRFRNIDETDDNSVSANGSGADYDSASNNDSRSVESEEHKDKASNSLARLEVIPGADNDKREKIRQKNERKHQRQKERRAQELYERCSGYLMSRKLEALSQQLVNMGVPAERATMALIINEGRVEDAVSWLFDGSEEADQHKDQNLDTGANLKIDISDELAQISEMEVKFKCSKQEVERVVVACEGDLVKAEETLRAQKQDPPTLSSKSEESSDPANSNGKFLLATNQNSVRLQQKPGSAMLIQARKDEKALNYTKTADTVGSTPKIVNKRVQPVTRIQQKLEWARPQQMMIPSEKKWPAGASSGASASYSLASSLQASAPLTKTESRYIPISAGSEYKNVHSGTTIREPVVMMQRPQLVNGKLMAPVNTSISSSPPGTAAPWYPSSSKMMKPNGSLPFVPTSIGISQNDLNSNHQLYQQKNYHQHHHQFMPGTSSMDLWKRGSSTPTLAVASNLGLFSGSGATSSSRPTSPVDWHTGGSIPSYDYNNIDWSLDRTSLPSMSKPTNGFWPSSGQPLDPKSDILDGLDLYFAAMGMNQAMRLPSSNGNDVSIAGFHDSRLANADSTAAGFQDSRSPNADTSAAGSHEWTSPFEGKDLFTVPRQFVSSPSH